MWVEIVDPDRTRPLRRVVLRSSDPADSALPGDGIANAVHFAALDDDARVVSTCFVFPDEWPDPDLLPAPTAAVRPDWHLRQMATDPARRGQGAGSAVLSAVIGYVTDRHGVLWCHARVAAIPFYERHGFTAVGAVHPSGESPIPHRYMYRASG